MRYNGIGRKRSGELNAIKNNKHQSFSTRANETRLELINKNRNRKASIEIIDKYDEQHNAIGTTIILIIPVNL